VDRRLTAKRAGNKSIADSLKITINGTFGKLGSYHSKMYAPNLLMQVTLTGQLALLMLIERVELAGFQVISANTDGITIKGAKFAASSLDRLIKAWERETGFETEETEYTGFYSRDVNNYIATKPDGSVKGIGIFKNPWADPKLALFRMHKNPVATICVEAVTEFLTKGTPCIVTIRNCRDVRKFVTIRKVEGGAVQGDAFLGKVVRWYYAHGVRAEMIRADSGDIVPESQGAKPLPELPAGYVLPPDVDFGWYEYTAAQMIRSLGIV